VSGPARLGHAHDDLPVLARFAETPQRRSAVGTSASESTESIDGMISPAE
jgi:hypothetical protein